MADLEVKGKDGKAAGKVKLVDKLGDAQVSVALVHQAVIAEQANSRQGTQSAKTRSEVRGGGKKPYKQKKTGNARQGTIRAPHYAHGGMALAVKPRDYEKKVNRKERRAALVGALAAQISGGHVVVADSISFSEPKTKNATALLGALGLGDVKRLLVVLPEYDAVTYKCFRNLPNVTVRTAPAQAGKDTAPKSATFSTRDLMVAHKILIAKQALERIQEVWS